MKKKYCVFVIISILSILAVSLFIFGLYLTGTFQNYFNEREDVTYKYDLKITSNGTKRYNVYLPVPIEIMNNLSVESKMISELKIIEGNATYSIIKTRYGIALNITFIGDIHLKVEGMKKWERWSTEDYDYTIFSMQQKGDIVNGVDIPYWVWINEIGDNETIFIELEAYFGNNEDEKESIIMGEINTNGWQIIYGSEECKVT